MAKLPTEDASGLAPKTYGGVASQGKTIPATKVVDPNNPGSSGTIMHKPGCGGNHLGKC